MAGTLRARCLMTANKTAHFVPDTNVFEQCEPLHQLDWSDWKDYEEVQILVTDPVMDEIDRHKGQGNSRVARKSRIFSSLLNEGLARGKSSYRAGLVPARGADTELASEFRLWTAASPARRLRACIEPRAPAALAAVR